MADLADSRSKSAVAAGVWLQRVARLYRRQEMVPLPAPRPVIEADREPQRPAKKRPPRQQ